MLEASRLAQLVASKVCHDMVEPMNALIQGLDMLKSQDAATRNADAIMLLEHGVNKAWAKLDFFRNALAGGMAGDGDASLEEMRATATRLFGALKPNLAWRAGVVTLPRAQLRVALNLLMIAADCLPKGGEVAVEAGQGDGGPEVRFVASGPRAVLRAETSDCLRGDAPEHGFQAYNIQPALTGMLARQAGAELLAREAPERIELVLRSAGIKLEPALAA